MLKVERLRTATFDLPILWQQSGDDKLVANIPVVKSMMP